MYKVIYNTEADRQLGRLPKEISKRIYDKITSTKENPFHFFVKLIGVEQYKLRVGDYRIIADIDASKEMIKVRVIRHRKNVYERWIFQLMWWM